MTAPQLKANFAVENKYGAFYTGGLVQMSKDGDHLFCQCGHTVQCLDVQSGKPSLPIGSEEDDEITCFTLSPDDEILVVASRNLQLKQWNWKEKIATRTWKAIHTGPISSMAFDVTSTLLATGGADASIKVWDVIKQYCTHNLHGHSGVISIVAFHPDSEHLQLLSAGDDYNIRVWNLQTSSCAAVLEGHYSVVTAIQFSPGGNTVYSAARDNVVIVWDGLKLTKLRTIPVYETIEGLVLLPGGRKFPAQNIQTDDPHFVTGGSKGILKVWNAATSQCVYPVQLTDGDGPKKSAEVGSVEAAITAVQHHASLDTLTVVTYDHNIAIHNLEDFTLKKQFVGYNDDVLDMQFVGADDSHLVVATNSQLVKVFEVETWSCQVLKGHTDIVLCVGVKKGADMFATGSKDNSIRVWQMDSVTRIVRCVAVGYGHTHAVNSVTFSRLSENFLVSGSHDCTLKVWPVPEPVADEILALTVSLTEHAHEKEINSVVITPNDKMVASGSQDKTAKLWSVGNLALLGVFRGHKRSIWCVQFSPVDQALVTASADGTLKVWSLTNFSCVKTFEGHQSSVLRVNFLTRGMQLLSSGSDGLLKLWTIKSNECIGTWDEHDEKVWALVVSQDEQRVITGAGDSTICVWKDITEEEQAEALRKQEEFILQEQQLANLVHDKKYVKAVGLAITLNKPFKVLGILKELLDGDEGRQDAVQTLHKLREDQIDSVLAFAAKWNTNSKHCHVAQFVVRMTLERFSPEQLLKLANVKATVEALLPYTERHFQRMNRIQQQTTFVGYTWQSMKMASMPPSRVEESEKAIYGLSHLPSWTQGGSGQVLETVGPAQIEVNPEKGIEEEESNSEDESDSDEADSEEVVSVQRKEVHKGESESSDDDTSRDSQAEFEDAKKGNVRKQITAIPIINQIANPQMSKEPIMLAKKANVSVVKKGGTPPQVSPKKTVVEMSDKQNSVSQKEIEQEESISEDESDELDSEEVISVQRKVVDDKEIESSDDDSSDSTSAEEEIKKLNEKTQKRGTPVAKQKATPQISKNAASVAQNSVVTSAKKGDSTRKLVRKEAQKEILEEFDSENESDESDSREVVSIQRKVVKDKEEVESSDEEYSSEESESEVEEIKKLKRKVQKQATPATKQNTTQQISKNGAIMVPKKGGVTPNVTPIKAMVDVCETVTSFTQKKIGQEESDSDDESDKSDHEVVSAQTKAVEDKEESDESSEDDSVYSESVVEDIKKVNGKKQKRSMPAAPVTKQNTPQLSKNAKKMAQKATVSSVKKGGTTPQVTPKKAVTETSDKENSVARLSTGKKTPLRSVKNTPGGTPGQKKQKQNQMAIRDSTPVATRQGKLATNTPQTSKRMKAVTPLSAPSTKRRKSNIK